MKRNSIVTIWLMGIVLAVGGCGAMPDFLVDIGKNAVVEVIEKSVEDAVEDFIDDFETDFWESSDLLEDEVEDLNNDGRRR